MWLTDLVDALRAGGCNVIEQGGWRGRGHGQMAGVRGVLVHHTGGGGRNDWNVVQNGRPGLDGPLAHMTLEADGTFRVIAAGQCWHAGNGGPLAGAPRNNGNAWLIGIEGVSNGRDWTTAQRREYPKGVAALLKHYRLDKSRCIAHKEWAPNRKVDPGNWDMSDFRADVGRYMQGVPAAPVQNGSYPPVLIEGIESMLVWRLQSFLNRKYASYSKIPIAAREEPSRWGPKSMAVMREFQKRMSVQPDGIVGAATWAALAKEGFKP